MKHVATLVSLLAALLSAHGADPSIISPVQPWTVRTNDPVVFAVAAGGTAPLSYQWWHDGNLIAGATTNYYSIAHAQSSDAGVYMVQVTNTLGQVSSSASLQVSEALLRLYPTNLTVLRTGNGTAALVNTGNPLFLDQLTTSGAYVSTVSVPDTGASALISHNGATDNYMSCSSNNRVLVFGGFNVSRPYSANLANTTATAVPRGIGAINGLGYYNLAVSDNNSIYDNKKMTGVASTDGISEFWTLGGSGVVYIHPSAGPDVQATTSGGRYSAGIYDGILYAAVSGAIARFSGLPTAAETPVNILSTGNPNDFALSPDRKTMYVTDGSNITPPAVGGVQRWDMDDTGTWSKTYTFATPVASATGNNGPAGLAVDFSNFTGNGASGSGAILYAVTGGTVTNSIVRIIDTGASSAVTPIYTSGVNQGIRGIRFAPEADPGHITQQPTDVASFPGGTVSFSVGYSGSAPIYFQWRRNGTNLLDSGNVSGVNSATLTLTNISSADMSPTYSVVVTNAIGGETSQNAALTMSTADPGILVNPVDVTTNYGATVRFSASAVGSATLVYRWQFNDSDLADGLAPSGATVSGSGTPVLTLANVPATAAGNYRLTVSNGKGTAYSTEAVLTVRDPAVITQPANLVLQAGATASFSASATGTAPLYFQWQKGSTALTDDVRTSGSQSSTLSISGLTAADAAVYNVLVSGGSGSSMQSSNATLTIVTPPQSRTVPAGDTVTLVANVSSPAALGYQWYFKGSPVANATSAALVLTNVQTTDGGSYSVLISNVSGGGAGTFSTTLNVSAGPIPLYPTNIVLLRAGDGSAGLANTGNPLFLDQFTTNGTYISSMMIPDSGPSALIGGSALTDEYMGISFDKRQLLFGGFNTTRPGSSSLSGATAAAVPRGIGSVNGLGTYQLAFSTTNATFNGSRILGVASTNGQAPFWIVTGSSTLYQAADMDPVVVTNSGRFSLTMLNGDLYVSRGGGIDWFTGMPSSASAGLRIAQVGNPNDFALSPDGNTLYVTDGSNLATGFGGVQRWDKTDGVWNTGPSYIFKTTGGSGNANGPDGLAVDFTSFTGGGASGMGAVIYVTTGEATTNSLMRIVDLGADSPVVPLVSAGPNQVLRGVRFGPLPTIPRPIIRITRSGQQVVIAWDNAVAGTTYRVQYKTDLSSGTWLDLTPDITAGGTTASKSDSIDSAARYYRVIVP